MNKKYRVGAKQETPTSTPFGMSNCGSNWMTTKFEHINKEYVQKSS